MRVGGTLRRAHGAAAPASRGRNLAAPGASSPGRRSGAAAAAERANLAPPSRWPTPIPPGVGGRFRSFSGAGSRFGGDRADLEEGGADLDRFDAGGASDRPYRWRSDRAAYESLKADTNHVLNGVPVGRMTRADHVTALSVMNAWAVRRSELGAESARRVLQRLLREEEGRRDRDRWCVGRRFFNVAMTAWAKCGSDVSAERVEELMRSMKDRSQRGGHRVPVGPDNYSYHALLGAVANSQAPDAPDRCEEILSEMEELAGDPLSAVRPETTSYNIVMNAYANQVGVYGCAEKAEDTLLKMSELSKDGDASVRPNTASFNTVLKAWQNSGEGTVESAIRAEEILRFMTKLNRSENEDVRPDPISFKTCLRMYTMDEDGGEEVANRVEGILQLLEETMGDKFGDDFTSCYNIAITAIGRSGVKDAGQRAESIFKRMIEMERTGKLNITPDDMTHAQVLYAWIRGDMEGAGEIPKEIFQRILDGVGVSVLDRSESSSLASTLKIKPNTDSFNMALRAIVSGSRYQDGVAAEKADELLKLMEDAPPKTLALSPDVRSYNTVLDAYTKIKTKGSAEKAFNVLKRLEKAYESGNVAAKPTSFSYCAVIAKCAKVGNDERAYETLKLAERQAEKGNTHAAPDIIAYNTVLGSLSRKGDTSAAQRALGIIKKMESMSMESDNAIPQPDLISYTSVINAWERSGNRDAPKVVLSLLRRLEQSDRGGGCDEIAYRSVLICLSRCKSIMFARKAYDVLQQMNQRHKDGYDSLQPNSLCCNLVVKAFADAGKGVEGAMRAQKVLFDLVNQHRDGRLSALPDTIGFNSVFHAWARAKHACAARYAGDVMTLMSELTDEGFPNIKPDKVTISCLINIYTGNMTEKAALKAQELFDQLESESSRSGDRNERLDKPLYEQVMNCWAKSNSAEKVQRSQDLLNRMKQRYEQGGWRFRPDTRTYNIILNCCAYEYGDAEAKKKALEVAKDMLEELEATETIKPDEITYGAMVKAIGHLCESEADCATQMKIVLDKCKARGLVGDLVMKYLQKTLSDSKLCDILGQDVDSEMPIDWVCNLKERRATKLAKMLGTE